MYNHSVKDKKYCTLKNYSFYYFKCISRKKSNMNAKNLFSRFTSDQWVKSNFESNFIDSSIEPNRSIRSRPNIELPQVHTLQKNTYTKKNNYTLFAYHFLVHVHTVYHHLIVKSSTTYYKRIILVYSEMILCYMYFCTLIIKFG